MVGLCVAAALLARGEAGNEVKATSDTVIPRAWRTVVYKPDPDHSVHLMGHFLPQKERPTLEMVLKQLSESSGGERTMSAMGQWRNPSILDYSAWPILSLAFGLPLPF
eukprot:UN4736